MPETVLDQVTTVLVLARHLGLTDAADWIEGHRDSLVPRGSTHADDPVKADSAAVQPPAASSGICGAAKGPLLCHKQPGHVGRHAYRTPTRPKPDRDWESIDRYYQRSGSRSYPIEVGNPVRVSNERGTWKVVRIERRITDPDRVNVEVLSDRTSHSRTFPSDRVKYMRPKKI